MSFLIANSICTSIEEKEKTGDVLRDEREHMGIVVSIMDPELEGSVDETTVRPHALCVRKNYR